MLLIITLLVLSWQAIAINPQNCSNYYSPTVKIPEECSNSTTCVFDMGLADLIDNFDLTNEFFMCLDMPGYTIHINPEGALLD